MQAELLQLVRDKKAQPFHKRILLHNQFATNFSMYVRAQPVFVNLLRSPGIDLVGRYYNPFFVPARQVTQAGGIDTSESISGLLKRLQIRAQR